MFWIFYFYILEKSDIDYIFVFNKILSFLFGKKGFFQQNRLAYAHNTISIITQSGDHNFLFVFLHLPATNLLLVVL